MSTGKRKDGREWRSLTVHVTAADQKLLDACLERLKPFAPSDSQVYRAGLQLYAESLGIDVQETTKEETT